MITREGINPEKACGYLYPFLCKQLVKVSTGFLRVYPFSCNHILGYLLCRSSNNSHGTTRLRHAIVCIIYRHAVWRPTLVVPNWVWIWRLTLFIPSWI